MVSIDVLNEELIWDNNMSYCHLQELLRQKNQANKKITVLPVEAVVGICE